MTGWPEELAVAINPFWLWAAIPVTVWIGHSGLGALPAFTRKGAHKIAYEHLRECPESEMAIIRRRGLKRFEVHEVITGNSSTSDAPARMIS